MNTVQTFFGPIAMAGTWTVRLTVSTLTTIRETRLVAYKIAARVGDEDGMSDHDIRVVEFTHAEIAIEIEVGSPEDFRGAFDALARAADSVRNRGTWG